MAKKKDKQHDAEVQASPAAARQEAGAGLPPKMKRNWICTQDAPRPRACWMNRPEELLPGLAARSITN
jgi:hypothetical protein